MSSFVICLQSLDPTSDLVWAEINDGLVQETGISDIEAFKSKLEESAASDTGKPKVIALLPDSELLFTRVEVPARSVARVRQAAKYVLEPLVADDIEDMHVALGVVNRSQAVPCVAILKTRLTQYLSFLSEFGVVPQVVSSLGLVANEADSLSLIQAIENPVLITPDAIVPTSNRLVIELAKRAVDDNEAIQSVKHYAWDGDSEIFSHFESALDKDLDFSQSTVVELLAKSATDQDVLNLLQGDFGRADDLSSQLAYQIGRLTTAVAVTLLVVSVLFLAEGFWARYQASDLLAESASIYQEIYGTDRVEGNPIFRMQEQMASVQSEGSWLPLLDAIRSAMGQVGVEIVNMDYQGDRNQLTITCLATSFDDFQRFEGNLTSSGLEVDVNSAEQQENLVLARVSLVL